MSGIIRKVDDLGRIVIPKEIRKNLNIKNNDDLEIIINDDKIILEKFYRLKSLVDVLNKYLKVLEKFLNSNYIIIDREYIILTSKKYSELNGKKVSLYIEELLNQRKSIIETYNKKINITNEMVLNCFFSFKPIIIEADILGGIIVLDDKKIEDKDLVVLDIFIQLLKEKLE